MSKPAVTKCLLCNRPSDDKKDLLEPADLGNTNQVDDTKSAPAKPAKPVKAKVAKPVKLSTKINKIKRKINKMFSIIKYTVIAIVVSCIVTAYPGTVTNTASAVLWTAKQVDSLTTGAISLARESIESKAAAKDSAK